MRRSRLYTVRTGDHAATCDRPGATLAPASEPAAAGEAAGRRPASGTEGEQVMPCMSRPEWNMELPPGGAAAPPTESRGIEYGDAAGGRATTVEVRLPPKSHIDSRGPTKAEALQADRARLVRLTAREREVFRLTAQGYSAPEIGARLAISPKTVDTYKLRIGEKAGLSHRAEYVQLALRLGLLAES